MNKELDISIEDQKRLTGASIGSAIGFVASLPFAFVLGFAGVGGIVIALIGQSLGILTVPLYFLFGLAGTLLLIVLTSALFGTLGYAFQFAFSRAKHIVFKILLAVLLILMVAGFSWVYIWYWRVTFW